MQSTRGRIVCLLEINESHHAKYFRRGAGLANEYRSISTPGTGKLLDLHIIRDWITNVYTRRLTCCTVGTPRIVRLCRYLPCEFEYISITYASQEPNVECFYWMDKCFLEYAQLCAEHRGCLASCNTYFRNDSTMPWLGYRNSRGISLLVHAGKVLLRVIVNCLIEILLRASDPPTR